MDNSEYLLYSQIEERHWWFRARREVLKRVLLEIEDHQNKNVLDVGCGVGVNFNMLFDTFNSVDGIDNNPEAVSFARKVSDNKVQEMDASSLSKITRKYDIISFLDVLYHRTIADYFSVLKDSKKVLSHDGYILIADGAFSFLSGSHSRHVHGSRRFTKKQLVQDLESLNYEIILSKYWGFFTFLLLFVKRRILERVFSHKQDSSDVRKASKIEDFLMYGLISWEKLFLNSISLPFGSSILILARKRTE